MVYVWTVVFTACRYFCGIHHIAVCDPYAVKLYTKTRFQDIWILSNHFRNRRTVSYASILKDRIGDLFLGISFMDPYGLYEVM